MAAQAGVLEKILNALIAQGGVTPVTANGVLEKILGTIPTIGASPSPGICQGRLTLTSGTPVTTADVTGATHIYFTPYGGNQISLYNSVTGWSTFAFSEMSVSVAAWAAGAIYDIFVLNNAGTIQLSAQVWTDPNTRSVALTTQNGVLVKSGAPQQRYVGTVAASGAGTTEDSQLNRLVWNYYNRVTKCLNVIETTNEWAAVGSTYRQTHGSTTNQLVVVTGVTEDATNLYAVLGATDNGVNAFINTGIGINSTTVNSANNLQTGNVCVATYSYMAACTLTIAPGVGINTFVWLEKTNGSTTYFFGNAGLAGIFQSGMSGCTKC